MKRIIFISIIILFPLVIYAQNAFEFTAGIGFTAIDIETLVEKDEVSGTVASDWGQFSTGLSGQYYFASRGNVTFGAELMYQYLYWYSVEVPFGTQTIYREYSVSAVKITPIARFGKNDNFKFDIGPELNFMGGLTLGLLLSSNYYVPVSENIDIPIKLRLDIISDIQVTLPVSLNAGIRIRM